MYVEIGLTIFGVALFLLVLFTLPILWKTWRAVNDITITLEALNQRLPGILKNMEEISANINNSTSAVNDKIQKYSATAERLHNVLADFVYGIELISPSAIRSPFYKKITEVIAVAKGVRVFLNVILGKERV
jgi:uncharacterized protein YoxC